MDFSTLPGSIQGAAMQALLWSIMSLGVYITFKILNFADMTVDGTFATGGAVTAVLITNGFNPYLSLLVAIAAGMICGLITGILHTKLEIPAILAGILTMIALYSINIRIMGDKSNIPLIGAQTIISVISSAAPALTTNIITMIIGLIFAGGVIALLYWYFGTEIGSAIRATGNNEYMVRALGVNTDNTKILGLVLSNGLIALSGAMVAQSQGYGDVGMGTGTIMIGLASIIIGEVLMGSRFSFAYKLLSVVVGSIIYRVIIALVLWFGLKSTDLKLFTSVVVILALSVPVLKRKLQKVQNTPESEEQSE
ncbi:MAG TPA: ABC transporter permease [Caproiciproducens sp.]|nr:ABC transporter permease [Caproiciproducens sp.]